MLLMSGTTDPIVRVENTEHLARKLADQNNWVTVRYYEGKGHLEPVIAMGALWRSHLPVLADITDFFTRFGAFPDPSLRPQYVAEPPVGEPDMDAVVAKLDSMLLPISTSKRREE